MLPHERSARFGRVATPVPEVNDPRHRWRLLGCGLLSFQAAALTVLAVVQAVAAAIGEGVVLRNEIMLVVTLLVAAAGLVVVAVGVLHGRTAVRTAGVFWQILLLAVVWFQWKAGLHLVALVVLVVAVAAAVSIVQATRQD
jgi:hypothetical protein